MTPCPVDPCAVDDCTRDAAPGRKRCHAHAKRATRGQSLSVPLGETYATPWERLTAAALAYADAGDDDVAFDRAKDRLRKAGVAYAQSLEDQPPPPPSAPARARRAPPEGQLVLWPEFQG